MGVGSVRSASLEGHGPCWGTKETCVNGRCMPGVVERAEGGSVKRSGAFPWVPGVRALATAQVANVAVVAVIGLCNKKTVAVSRDKEIAHLAAVAGPFYTLM